MDFGDPLGVPPPKGETVSGTDMYRRAKFHADRYHRRQDICNRTDRQNYSRLNIRQNALRFVDNKFMNTFVSIGLFFKKLRK